MSNFTHLVSVFSAEVTQMLSSGYNYAVDTIKSLVLVLALMDKYMTVERCVQLSRLEQDFQVGWEILSVGLAVETTHYCWA